MSSGAVGKLSVVLSASANGLKAAFNATNGYIRTFRSGIAPAKTETEKLGTSIRKMANELQRAAKSLRTIEFAAVAVLANRVGHAMFGWFTETNRLNQELIDQSRRMGVSVQALRAMGYAAKVTGSDTDVLVQATSKLQVALGRAATGASKAQKLFADLGINWRSLVGIRADQALYQVADALSRTPSMAERAALAVGLLGKNATKLLETFSAGGKALQKWADIYEIIGGTQTSQQTIAIDLLGDSIDSLTASWRAFKTSLLGTFSGPLMENINKLTAMLSAARGGFSPAETAGGSMVQRIYWDAAQAYHRAAASVLFAKPGSEVQRGHLERADMYRKLFRGEMSGEPTVRAPGETTYGERYRSILDKLTEVLTATSDEAPAQRSRMVRSVRKWLQSAWSDATAFGDGGASAKAKSQQTMADSSYFGRIRVNLTRAIEWAGLYFSLTKLHADGQKKAADDAAKLAAQAAKRRAAEVAAFRKEIETEAEKYERTLARLRRWRQTGIITREEFRRGKAAADADADAYLRSERAKWLVRNLESGNITQAEFRRNMFGERLFSGVSPAAPGTEAAWRMNRGQTMSEAQQIISNGRITNQVLRWIWQQLKTPAERRVVEIA